MAGIAAAPTATGGVDLTSTVKPAILDVKLGLKTEDNMLAWHFYRNGKARREILFKIRGSNAIYRDPVTKQEFMIGKVLEIDGAPLIVVFFVDE